MLCNRMLKEQYNCLKHKSYPCEISIAPHGSSIMWCFKYLLYNSSNALSFSDLVDHTQPNHQQLTFAKPSKAAIEEAIASFASVDPNPPAFPLTTWLPSSKLTKKNSRHHQKSRLVLFASAVIPASSGLADQRTMAKLTLSRLRNWLSTGILRGKAGPGIILSGLAGTAKSSTISAK